VARATTSTAIKHFEVLGSPADTNDQTTRVVRRVSSEGGGASAGREAGRGCVKGGPWKVLHCLSPLVHAPCASNDSD